MHGDKENALYRQGMVSEGLVTDEEPSVTNIIRKFTV